MATIIVPKKIPPTIPEARDFRLEPVIYSGDVTIQETDDKYIITANSDAWIVIYDRGVRTVAEYIVEDGRIDKKIYSKYLEQYL